MKRDHPLSYFSPSKAYVFQHILHVHKCYPHCTLYTTRYRLPIVCLIFKAQPESTTTPHHVARGFFGSQLLSSPLLPTSPCSLASPPQSFPVKTIRIGRFLSSLHLHPKINLKHGSLLQICFPLPIYPCPPLYFFVMPSRSLHQENKILLHNLNTEMAV